MYVWQLRIHITSAKYSPVAANQTRALTIMFFIKLSRTSDSIPLTYLYLEFYFTLSVQESVQESSAC